MTTAPRPDFDWWDFPYHLQFLALYSGEKLDDEKWEVRLGEPSKAASERLLFYGLIERIPAEELIRQCNVDQLKGWCKAHGLKCTGKKAELAERLLTNRASSAFEYAEHLERYRQTSTGAALAAEFLTRFPWGASDDWFDPSDQMHVIHARECRKYSTLRLAEMKEVGVDFVEVLGSGLPGGDCTACLAIGGVKIPIGKAPLLPLEGCDRAACKCILIGTLEA